LSNNPHFTLRLWLSGIGETEAGDPLLTNELVNEAWHTLNALIMDALDEQGEEIEDEHFRELFIELCYWLLLREMSILRLMPQWERNFKDSLARGKRIQRLPKRREDT
jgi:hypothetical protein